MIPRKVCLTRFVMVFLIIIFASLTVRNHLSDIKLFRGLRKKRNEQFLNAKDPIESKIGKWYTEIELVGRESPDWDSEIFKHLSKMILVTRKNFCGLFASKHDLGHN